MFYIVDEAQNPAPPGMLVTITDTTGNSQSGYTTASGAVPSITLVPSTQYTMAFYAQRGPSSLVRFTTPLTSTSYALDGDGSLDNVGSLDDGSLPSNTAPAGYFVSASYGDTSVLVVGYRSPYLAKSGAAELQSLLFPLRRAGSNASTTPAIQAGVAATFASLDAQAQVVHGALRLQSSANAAIDTWVADFLGAQTLPRVENELDPAYITRALQWFALPFGTLAGVAAVVESFLQTVSLNALLGPIAGDTLGAADTAGGADGGTLSSAAIVVPKVKVFDCQSDPQLAATVGLVATKSQFCVLFTFPNATAIHNWALGSGAAGVSTFLAAPTYYTLSACPSPPLDALIGIVKLGGSVPVYVANHPSE